MRFGEVDTPDNSFRSSIRCGDVRKGLMHGVTDLQLLDLNIFASAVLTGRADYDNILSGISTYGVCSRLLHGDSYS